MKNIEWKPIKDRVLIRPDKPDTLGKAGIIIPESAQTDKLTGDVVAIGREVTDIKVGDRVMWGEFAKKATVVIKSGEYRYMKEDQILLYEEAAREKNRKTAID